MPRSSRSNTNQPGSVSSPEVATGKGTVGTFLRNLAARADADAALATEIQAALAESGLLSSSRHPRQTQKSQRKPEKAVNAAPPAQSNDTVVPSLDPFRVLRDHGEKGLHETLESLEIAQLRAIVRKHRLDPARISARWRDQERVIQLIVSQVKAQATYGKAFSHV